MAPDEAADLLEELPEALRERFVATLSAADAATVTDLLSHEPDTAGSVMNPEVFTVAPGTRMGEIKELLRAGPPELVRSYAVLVVGSDSRLRGKVSYVDLIRSRDDAAVDELMDPDPESVRADDPMEDVAELFDRFNLLSLPVVDRDGMLEGVITVDDVVAWLREGEGREGGLT